MVPVNVIMDIQEIVVIFHHVLIVVHIMDYVIKGYVDVILAIEVMIVVFVI